MANMDLIVTAGLEGIDELFADIDILSEKLDDLRISLTFEEDEDMCSKSHEYTLEEIVDLQAKVLVSGLNGKDLLEDRDNITDSKVLFECLLRLVRLPEFNLHSSLRDAIKDSIAIKNSGLHRYLSRGQVSIYEIKEINNIIELMSKITSVIDELD